MTPITVHEILADAAYRHPLTPIISGETRLTYSSLYERTVQMAESLTRLGIARGTVVGVRDVNSHRHMEVMYALSMVDAVTHSINFRLPETDLLWTVHHARDEWLFLWEGFEKKGNKVASPVRHVVWMWDGLGTSHGHDYNAFVSEGRFHVPDVSAVVSSSD